MIYNHFWVEYALSSNFFIIFVTNDIFKILFTKRKLIRYYYFTNIHIVYQNRAFILMQFVFFNFTAINFYIFYPFLYMVLIFFKTFLIYNFSNFFIHISLLKQIFVYIICLKETHSFKIDFSKHPYILHQKNFLSRCF